MKITTLIPILGAFTSSLIFSACGGGGSSNSSGVLVGGSTGNTSTSTTNTNFNEQTVDEQGIIGAGDAAPSTLDRTTLKLFENEEFIFELGRISGDASVIGATEIGFANSIQTGGNAAGGFFTGSDSGADIANDLPRAASDISYRYTRTGTNSATFTFTGDLSGDGVGNIDLNAQSATSDPPDLLSNDDAASAVFFLTFGTDGETVTELAVSGRNLSNRGGAFLLDAAGNIADPPQVIPVIGTIDYDANTANNNTFIKTQEGSPLPLGYSTVQSANVNPVVPLTVYPSNLSNAGSLYLSFDTTGDMAADTYYHYFGATSQDVGLIDVIDQGTYRLEIYAGPSLIGATLTTSIEGIPYGWKNTAGSIDEAELEVFIPGMATQQYRMNFISFERGSIIDVNGGAPGDVLAFEFPQRDQSASVVEN